MNIVEKFKTGAYGWLKEEESYKFTSGSAKKTLATAKACNKLAQSLTVGDFENGRQDDLLKKLKNMSARLEKDDNADITTKSYIVELIKILDGFEY